MAPLHCTSMVLKELNNFVVVVSCQESSSSSEESEEETPYKQLLTMLGVTEAAEGGTGSLVYTVIYCLL